MRSKPWKEFETTRDRIVMERFDAMLDTMPKARPFCTFREGRLMRGQQSGHRTRAARLWRTVLRWKARIGSTWTTRR